MKSELVGGGFVELQEVMGSELTIVNAARVSFGKQKTVLDEGDLRLLDYLIRNRHYSPLRHVFMRFHIRAPEFVMRQWFKHVVGSEWSSEAAQPLHGWNEISGRYLEWKESYHPIQWRRQSSSAKQGSDGVLGTDESDQCHQKYRQALHQVEETYHELLNLGVAKEQARMILPLSTFTECIWTASLQAVLHFILLRTDSHAQEEIQEYAHILRVMVQEQFPHVLSYYLSHIS